MALLPHPTSKEAPEWQLSDSSRPSMVQCLCYSVQGSEPEAPGSDLLPQHTPKDPQGLTNKLPRPVLQLPARLVVQPPQSQGVGKEAYVSFLVAPLGSPGASAWWYLQGTTISGSGSHLLLLLGALDGNRSGGCGALTCTSLFFPFLFPLIQCLPT